MQKLSSIINQQKEKSNNKEPETSYRKNSTKPSKDQLEEQGGQLL